MFYGVVPGSKHRVSLFLTIFIYLSIFNTGIFVSGRFQGHGLLLAEDDTCYDGEFASDGLLHGRGRMTFPNGSCVEGTFAGAWADRNGLKVCLCVCVCVCVCCVLCCCLCVCAYKLVCKN